VGPGRPPVSQTDGLLSALVWATNQKNMRREQDTRDRMMTEGLLSRHVAYSVVSSTLTNPDTTPLLEEALLRTRDAFGDMDPDATPLKLAILGDTFAIDSTGFTPSRRGHYNHEKHGPDEPIPWLKLHLMVSTRAHLITSARITENKGEGTGDTSQFAPLARRVGPFRDQAALWRDATKPHAREPQERTALQADRVQPDGNHSELALFPCRREVVG
jgi:hypothetical protein